MIHLSIFQGFRDEGYGVGGNSHPDSLSCIGYIAGGLHGLVVRGKQLEVGCARVLVPGTR